MPVVAMAMKARQLWILDVEGVALEVEVALQCLRLRVREVVDGRAVVTERLPQVSATQSSLTRTHTHTQRDSKICVYIF